MRHLKIVAAAVAALTSTIGMAAAPEQRLEHQGRTYVYTSTPAKGGRTVIEGRQVATGEAFRLIVRGDRVTGTSGGVPVAFRVAQARGAAGGTETAAR